MRRLITLAAILLCLTACQSPGRQWAAASITYTRTLEAMTSARAVGIIDDDEYRRIEQVRAPLGKAIDRAEAQLDAGDTEAASMWLDAADTLADELIDTYLEAQR